jgi:phosphatidate cytidylyltransferase
MTKNLFLRIATALCLIPIVIYSLFNAGIGLMILLAVLSLLCTVEITNFIGQNNNIIRVIGLVSWASIFIALVLIKNISLSIPILALGIILIQIIILFDSRADRKIIAELLSSYFLIFYVTLGVASVYWLRNGSELLPAREGLSFILLACMSTWANDSVAYFCGRALGKHPLFKSVSAKKTWEGFLGAAFLSPLLILGLFWLSKSYNLDLFTDLSFKDFLFICLPTMIIAPLGDLAESRFKRLYDVKDSSNLLPGHGGFFDRIDSLLFVLPLTALYAFHIRLL